MVKVTRPDQFNSAGYSAAYKGALCNDTLTTEQADNANITAGALRLPSARRMKELPKHIKHIIF
jgi:hypothetical protein